MLQSASLSSQAASDELDRARLHKRRGRCDQIRGNSEVEVWIGKFTKSAKDRWFEEDVD